MSIKTETPVQALIKAKSAKDPEPKLPPAIRLARDTAIEAFEHLADVQLMDFGATLSACGLGLDMDSKRGLLHAYTDAGRKPFATNCSGGCEFVREVAVVIADGRAPYKYNEVFDLTRRVLLAVGIQGEDSDPYDVAMDDYEIANAVAVEFGNKLIAYGKNPLPLPHIAVPVIGLKPRLGSFELIHAAIGENKRLRPEPASIEGVCQWIRVYDALDGARGALQWFDRAKAYGISLNDMAVALERCGYVNGMDYPKPE